MNYDLNDVKSLPQLDAVEKEERENEGVPVSKKGTKKGTKKVRKARHKLIFLFLYL